jgi:serine O-acetyltransferase
MINNLIAIIGYFDGSAGQVEEWIEETTGYKISCFIIDSNDFKEINIENENNNRVCKTLDFPNNNIFKGHEIVYSKNWVEELRVRQINKVISLESNNQLRYNHIEIAKENNIELISAIHPSVRFLNHSKIEKGIWLNANCLVGYKAEIRQGTILNTGVQIDHHNILMECCQLDPRVTTAGNVIIEKFAHIHTASVIINRVTIGENCEIGAGSLVLKNIPKNSVAYGQPAKIKKYK